MKMRNSYIANSAEALNLHNGSQAAIVVAMKVQPTPNKFNPQNVDFEMSKGDRRHKGTNVKPENLNCPLLGILDLSPYALGQEVYVREGWHKGGHWQTQQLNECTNFKEDEDWFWHKETAITIPENTNFTWIRKSPATMPKSAARTRFKIVSCEAVRVKDLKGSQKAFEDFCKQFGIKKIPLSKPYGVNKATHAYSLVDMQGSDEFLYENCLRDYYGAFGNYIAQKLGDKAWDNNHFIWFYKIEKI
jgi:hypothetical protein